MSPFIELIKNPVHRMILGAMLAMPFPTSLQAGGGLVLENDVCIIWIDFYSAHFTAFQPGTSGNEQFCQALPHVGETIFVMDYLHQSLKEVPVELRVIRDVTGQGRYVKLKHVEDIADLEKHTVFHLPPTVQADASLTVEMDFREKGDYIGIVSAGHPSTDEVFTAVFPLTVGATGIAYWVYLLILLASVASLVLWKRMKR